MSPLDSVDGADAEYELVVVGSGPSGLAAATTAAGCGVKVLVVDENPGPGGQIYRSIASAPAGRRRLLGPDYRKGEDLLRDFTASDARYLPGTVAWMISPGREVGLARDGRARLIRARNTLIATGALERPFPIEGWTLPGVLTVGAAQGLLKSAGLVPDGRVVLAGTGPLLWLFAAQMIACGVRPAAVLDTTVRGHVRQALPGLLPFLGSSYFGKGMSLVRSVRADVPVIFGVTRLAAHGRDGIFSAVSYTRGTGRPERLEADTLLLHQGVVPNVNLAVATGCGLEWNEAQACWAVVADNWGRTSVEKVSVAGDGAGIEGAAAAAERGRLCGLDIAFQLGRIDAAARDRASEEIRRDLSRNLRGRRFIDVAFRPDPAFRVATGKALACRCEEITGDEVVGALKQLGAVGPNQLKSFVRCGMGPCQGRMCGPTITEMIAAERRVPPSEIGYFHLRTPVKPLTIAEIAQLAPQDGNVAFAGHADGTA